MAARGWKIREGGGDARRLWGAELAEAESHGLQVLEMSVDRSQSCWVGAQAHKVWEAKTTTPRLMAAVLALGGSWIGRGLQSVSKHYLTPCFDPPDGEE